MTPDVNDSAYWRNRIRASVVRENGCWLWQRAKTNQGYGSLVIGGERWKAHRLAYSVFRGPIPEGLYVCHKCDVPQCVNPYHLFLGTHSDNMQDASKKGRNYWKSKTHCPRGHAYDEANTYYRANGYRQCRKCQEIYDRNRPNYGKR